MTLHLLKPAVQVDDLYEFADRQKNFLTRHQDGQILFPVWTSRRPARANELLNGGSVYWIIKRHIACRQDIIDIVELPPGGGREKPAYLIMADPVLIRTQARPKKPFQGWRYLKPQDAPADIGKLDQDKERPPPEMEEELIRLGLL